MMDWSQTFGLTAVPDLRQGMLKLISLQALVKLLTLESWSFG